MKKLAVVGTKEFSRQVIDLAVISNCYEFVGYIDDIEEKGTLIDGMPVLGNIDESLLLFNQKKFDCLFICIGYTRFDLREFYYAKIKGMIPLATIIASSAIIHPSAKIGEGVIVGELVNIGKHVIIEDNVVILNSASIGHNSIIHKHSYLAGCNSLAGYVKIMERCFLGLGSIVADNIYINPDIWIGIGCVVAKSLENSGKYISKALNLIRCE